MIRAAPLALLLAGCVATVPGTPVAGSGPRQCHDAGLERFVGRAVSAELGGEVLQASGAQVLRWSAPGRMMTMDYRLDRVTVHYGPDRKVTRVRCG